VTSAMSCVTAAPRRPPACGCPPNACQAPWEELELLGLDRWRLNALACAPLLGVTRRLPRLRSVRAATKDSGATLRVTDVPLLEAAPGVPGVEVDGWEIVLSVRLLERVGYVRVVAAGGVALLADQEEDVAACVHRLCHADLQAAELRAERRGIHITRNGEHITLEVVCEMVSRCGDCFAFEVGVAEQPRSGEHAELRRLAWRGWPAPGAPSLPAARAAHERACAWLAELEQR